MKFRKGKVQETKNGSYFYKVYLTDDVLIGYYWIHQNEFYLELEELVAEIGKQFNTTPLIPGKDF